MKDSSKLFLCAFGVLFAGFLKGIAPTVLEQPFDSGSFLILSAIALIVVVLGFIKRSKDK